jgi:hypothetical protein
VAEGRKLLKRDDAMWAMATQDDAEFFTNHRSILSVYLSDGLSPAENKFFFEIWQGFDVYADKNWHLLVPTRGQRQAQRLNELKEPAMYDAELANKLREIYRVPGADLPALVFEDFKGNTEKPYISLAGKTDDEKTAIVRKILSIVSDEIKHGPEDLNDFRERTFEAIKRLSTKDRSLGISLKATAVAATVITIVSGIRSFF